MAGMEYDAPPGVVGPGEKQKGKRTLYHRAVDFEGNRHHVGDYVIMEQKDKEVKLHVPAEIFAIWVDKATKMPAFRYRWFWTGKQIEIADKMKGFVCKDEKEVYVGDEVEVGDCDCILGKCTVLSRDDYMRLKQSKIDPEKMKNVYFCENSYSYLACKITFLGKMLFPGEGLEKAGFKTYVSQAPTQVPEASAGYAPSNVEPTRVKFRPRVDKEEREDQVTGVHLI